MTPCRSCIKKGYQCCNRLPLFKNEELAKLIDDKVLEKLDMKIKIIRYEKEVYTCLNLQEDENLQIKESQEGKRSCIFLGEEGCKLGEYMPEYCKLIKDCNSIISCPFCGIEEKELEKMEKEELEKLYLKNKKSFLNYEIAYNKIFDKELKKTIKLTKKLKVVKDELFFYMVFYLLLQNRAFLKEKKIVDIELRPHIYLHGQEILIVKKVHFIPLTDNPALNIFFKKLTNIANFTISSYFPEKQAIIENKLTSLLNGVHNAKEEYLKGYNGLLFAVLLLYIYKEKYKMKDKRFKGILAFKEFNELGDEILERMDEEFSDDEIEKIFKEINAFAEALFKKIIKEKI